ncbi:MAG: hypothetical protein ACK5Q5_23390, partial [Planctomycetaceae bacterium]
DRLSVGNSVQSVAVNVNEAESQPATLDEAALAQGILKGTSFTYDREWRSSTARLISPAARGSLSGPLLATTLVLLVIEKLVGWNSRLGVAALALAGAGVAIWQTWQFHSWLALALLLLLTATGIVLRFRLSPATRIRHIGR